MQLKFYAPLVFSTLFCSMTYANPLLDSFDGQAHLNLNLYAFAADVDGTIHTGKLAYEVEQPFKETVKNLDRAFMAHLDLSKGKWGVYVDKEMIKTSQDKAMMHIPIAINTKLDQSSYGIYYQAYVSPETTKNNYAKLIVEPTIGMHHTKVDATLGALQQHIQAKSDWDEFFWGSRFKYNFDSPWNLTSEVTFGVENTISAQAYLGYRFPVLNRNNNLRIGYRYLDQDHKTNNFKWDVRQHGPVIGINLPIF